MCVGARATKAIQIPPTSGGLMIATHAGDLAGRRRLADKAGHRRIDVESAFRRRAVDSLGLVQHRDHQVAAALEQLRVRLDEFLGAVQRTQNPVTMFLVNGVMLQGDIAAYDLFCLLLQRDDFAQLVYKHAISTVVPGRAVNFHANEGDEGCSAFAASA